MLLQPLRSSASSIILILTCIARCAGLFSRYSPCTDVFRYEDSEPGDDRWYGDITLAAAEMSEDAIIKITLDRSSHLLASWAGNVITNDNKVYMVKVNETIFKNRSVFRTVRIMIKYDPLERIPLLEAIHFNGRQLCPYRSSIEAEYNGNRPESESALSSDALYNTHSITPLYSPGAPISKKPNEIECGVPTRISPLILNGQKAHFGQWPWHVSLYRTNGINLDYIGGGSLVSRNKVITAAHFLLTGPDNRVINSKSLVVYVGKFNLRQHSLEQGVQTKEVYHLNVNPAYDSNTFHNDIAVLTLSSDVQFTDYVRPACVWEPENSIDSVVGKEGMLVGWGLNEYNQASEELNVAKLPVVSQDTCIRSFPTFYTKFVSDKSFCAGIGNGTSPCRGDGGNGLFFKRNFSWYLRGIVSLSVSKVDTNFCDTRHYAVFTDVAQHNEFLRRTL